MYRLLEINDWCCRVASIVLMESLDAYFQTRVGVFSICKYVLSIIYWVVSRIRFETVKLLNKSCDFNYVSSTFIYWINCGVLASATCFVLIIEKRNQFDSFLLIVDCLSW